MIWGFYFKKEFYVGGNDYQVLTFNFDFQLVKVSPRFAQQKPIHIGGSFQMFIADPQTFGQATLRIEANDLWAKTVLRFIAVIVSPTLPFWLTMIKKLLLESKYIISFLNASTNRGLYSYEGLLPSNLTQFSVPHWFLDYFHKGCFKMVGKAWTPSCQRSLASLTLSWPWFWFPGDFEKAEGFIPNDQVKGKVRGKQELLDKSNRP